MDIENKDIVCSKILSSIAELEQLLDNENGTDYFDIKNSPLCSEKRIELHRLHRSLNQYVSKSKALFYIGFVGHFSSGKSSTINSLLKLWGQKGERLTGLHPTDKAVTMITDPSNATSLIGSHSRGEIEVGSVLVESISLKSSVIVDTPGAGDPSIIKEMVRDFLPICDQIIYVFSAANPLDDTDLPVLTKSHEQLPFIPIKIVVTRADEFKADNRKEFSAENFNSERAGQFVAELISRLASMLPGKAVPEENILLIDNLTQYGIETLRDFIFNCSGQANDVQSLHAHKIVYYLNNSKIIRDFFKAHISKKIAALNSLVTTAKNNHKEYQRTVLIGNNRLTEDWNKNLDEITKIKIDIMSWVGSQPSKAELSATVSRQPMIIGLCDSVRKDIDFSAVSEVDTLTRSIRSHLSNILYDLVRLQIDQITTATIGDLEKFRIPLPEEIEDKYKIIVVRVPNSCAEKIERVESVVISEIKTTTEGLVKSLENLSILLDRRDLPVKSTGIIDRAEWQITEMLDTFFKSVNLYKAAILAINARELAEQLSIGKAIDDLEQLEIPEARKLDAKLMTVGKIFVNKDIAYTNYESNSGVIYEKATELLSSCRRLNSITKNTDNLEDIQRKIRSCKFDRSTNGVDQIILEIQNDFRSRVNILFQSLQNTVQTITLQNFNDYRVKASIVRRERLRRFLGAGTVGAILGVIAFLWYFKSGYPTPGNLTATIAIAGFSDLVLAAVSWGLVAFFDRSNEKLAQTKSDFFDATKSKILSEVSATRLEDYNFVDNYSPRLKECIKGNWNQLLASVIYENIEVAYRDIYDKLTKLFDTFESFKVEYQNNSKKLLDSLSGYFEDSNKNLDILQEVADQIKEEAILPSFTMFEHAESDLQIRLDKLRDIEFA